MNHSAPKILYTASSSAHLVSFHLPYLAALRSLGWDVTAAANGSGEDLGEGVRFLAVPFTKSFASPKNFRAAALLARDIRKNRYDVIVTHTSLAAFFTRLGVMLAGKKHTRVVNTVHGYLFDGDSGALRRTVLLAAEKLTAGVTDDILVMNRCDEQIAKKHRLCRGNVYFIPGMGVDFSRFPPAAPEERAAAKAAYFLPEDAVCLVCAAEFSKRKNQTLLLQTLARLPENYYLLLPGDGALLQECKAEAETLGISSRSRFPGRISDVRGALAAADICVSASRSEGLPFAVMEAMHTALPCVLTRVKGHEDLLEGSSAGYLVPFGDAAAFAEAVQTLGRDAALRALAEQYLHEGIDTLLTAFYPRFCPILPGTEACPTHSSTLSAESKEGAALFIVQRENHGEGAPSGDASAAPDRMCRRKYTTRSICRAYTRKRVPSAPRRSILPSTRRRSAPRQAALQAFAALGARA